MNVSPNCWTPGVSVPPSVPSKGFDYFAAPDHRVFAKVDYGRGYMRPVASDVTWRGGSTFAVGTDRRVDAYDPLTRRAHNVFQRIGTSYLDALLAAQRETRGSTLVDGSPSWNATAVLRGRDGAFWITSVGTADGTSYPVRIDSPDAKLPAATRVERLHEQLLAVVGGRTWVDFSGIDVDFDPARP